jgi:RNA polymerase sigma factor (sigma-70 family)
MNSDDDLAVRAGRDPQAFIALYDRYYQRIYRYIRYRCADRAAAEDLASQVFEQLLLSIREYAPVRGPFEPWLFAIARHRVADFLRRQRLYAWLPWETIRQKPCDDPSPEEAAERYGLRERLRALLADLSPRERDLLGLKFGASLTYRQVSALIGMREGTVAVTVHRALEKLRAALAEEDREILEADAQDVEEVSHA